MMFEWLDQFADITNLIMAVCYHQESEEALNEFVTIIRNQGQLNRNLQQNIQRMGGKVGIATVGVSVQKNGLIPVPAGRFQVMPISDKTPIKTFIEENGITFHKGRAFYQLTKTETVQQHVVPANTSILYEVPDWEM